MSIDYYKMVVCDVDGTLVNSDKQVTEINKKAIKDYKANGGLFSLATGRIEKSVHRFCEELNIDVPVILYNGARIFDPVNKQILYDQKLNPHEIERALMILETLPLDPIFYSKGEAYVLSHTERIEEYQRGDGFLCRRINSKDEVRHKEISKILMIGDAVHFDTFKTAFQNDPDCQGILVQSEYNYLEILPKGVNKGTALAVLAEYMGLKTNEIMCFGDNMNDLEMLRAAGMGVAMNNAHQTLKESADMIAPSNNESGVGQIMNRLQIRELK